MTSFSRDDGGNRERARTLLMAYPYQWVSALELHRVAGSRYGARIHELRSAGHIIDCDGAVGCFSYRWRGLGPPPVRKSWKQRALAAEARVKELESALEGAGNELHRV